MAGLITKKVYIDDYSWFLVVVDGDGAPQSVTECRVVWTPELQPLNAMMSERIKRAIEQARTGRD